MQQAYDTIHKAILAKANKEKAAISARFFKTGPGEYGEGDIFVGIIVPEAREIARQFRDVPMPDIKKLLRSTIHEERIIALFILIFQYQKATPGQQKNIVDWYLAHTRYINNWDLVDCSAHKILGAYLLDKPKKILKTLARSPLIWERRIAIITTYAFIQKNHFDPTLDMAQILLNDTHDLIHKAVGWMLREVGKKSQKTEENFLQKYYQYMPRTMLRYAIEKFPPAKKAFYMKKKGL